MIRLTSRVLFMMALLTVVFALSGCGYTLRGKVVRGDSSRIELIHEIDQRLKQPGLGNVEVVVRRNPKSPNPEMVGRTRSDAGGEFAAGLKDFGAGWMQEQWLVQARLTGYQNASSVMQLPAKDSKWRLLITLAPGESSPFDAHEEIIQDLDRFK